MSAKSSPSDVLEDERSSERVTSTSLRTIDPFSVSPHHFPQVWLWFVSFVVLGFAVLYTEALLAPVFALDKSHVTALVAALVGAGSIHAAWHILRYSRRIELLRGALEQQAIAMDLARSTAGPGKSDTDTRFVAAWLRDAHANDTTVGDSNPEQVPSATAPSIHHDLLELYADRLRSPVDLGWFLVDVTVRLGLLGTIIGFILIFSSLTGVSIDGAEGLRDLLVAMSGGMGTALLTTLAGLVGATLLSVQYLILGREAEHLLGMLARYRAEYGRRSVRLATAVRARAVLDADRHADSG